MLTALATAAFAFVMGVPWFALLLAELGHFTPWPCLAFGAVLAAAVFHLSARDGTGLREHPAMLVALALVALAPFYFTRHPGELILGGWDPGVYVHTAAHIFRTGALLIHQPDLNALTPAELAILTRTTSGIVGPFTGMWMLPDGRLSPQFHHLYPSLLAVAFPAGGVRAALLVNPLLNAGCILLMFALARRFVRAPFALAAAVLLAVNPAQLWQAKFCTAEMLGQFLLLGGSVFFLDALAPRADGAPRRRATPWLAGAAYGLALLARYDTVIMLAPLAALTLAAWPWLASRRDAVRVLLSFLPFLVHHLVHHRCFAPYYQPVSGLVLVALALCLGAALAWVLLMRSPVARRFAVAHARWLPRLAAAAVAAWWCLVWLRPHLPAGVPGGADAGNVYFLVAIFGPLVALFAAALPLWIVRERNIVHAIWLYAATVVLMVVTTSVFNDHFLMWVARRFIPVAVPLLVLAFVKLLERIVTRRVDIAAILAAEKPRLPAGRRLIRRLAPGARRRAAAFAVLAAAVAMHLPATRAMGMLRDWPGLVDWCGRVAAAIPDGADVFSDQRGFAAPLRFLHGCRAYELHLAEKDPARRDRLAELMSLRAARGGRVFLLTLNGSVHHHGSRCIERGRFALSSQKMATSMRQVPSTTSAAGGTFVLYEIAPP